MLTSLTPAQKAVLAACLVALVLGFWLGAGGRGGERPDDVAQVTYVPADPADTPTIVVHVIGEVQQPGLYRLDAGARVHDAIEAAGGFTSGARPESVNLAAYCEDGDQISVGAKPADSPLQAATPQPTPSASPRAEPASSAEPAATPKPGLTPGNRPVAGDGTARQSALPPFARSAPRAPVRVNHAGLEELQELPGVGPELAKRILYHRAMHGPFRSFKELEEVPGIGPATVEEIRIRATLN